MIQRTFTHFSIQQGVCEIAYYETTDGNIFLGATFSLATSFQGFEVSLDSVLDWDKKVTYPISSVRRLEQDELYQLARNSDQFIEHTESLIGHRKSFYESLGIPREDTPFLEEDDEYYTTDQPELSVWLKYFLSQFESQKSMLESLWPSAPDLSTKGLQPTTSLSVLGLQNTSVLWPFREILQRTCINQGISMETSTKIVDLFLQECFGDRV